VKISITELHQKVVATLTGAGFKSEEAEKVAEYLVWADASGVATQGVIKLTGGAPIQNVEPNGDVTIERDTKLSQLINGGNHLSAYVSQVAVERAIAKAKEHGFAIVGVHNVQSSNGSQAHYVNKIAEQGLIGISAARATSSTAAFGGIDPVFGTNPIGFAFPTTKEPIVFDMATSAMTWFGLVLAKAKGETLPENMAIDAEGNPTLDPEAAMSGALRSFDRSYKGSGLGLMVEILAGPLVGASFASMEGEWGTVFIVIDPELLIDAEQFKANCTELVERVKAARKQNGVSEIRLPGERAAAARAEAAATGMVEVEDAILKQLGYV
jgi:L-2-hydroxycarboxylate dehydrogenase (NAD+)